MGGFIEFLVYIYLFFLTFSVWSCYKIAKYELKRGIDITIGYLFLSIFVSFTPVINLFFSFFILAECREEVFTDSIFSKVLIKGKVNG